LNRSVVMSVCQSGKTRYAVIVRICSKKRARDRLAWRRRSTNFSVQSQNRVDREGQRFRRRRSWRDAVAVPEVMLEMIALILKT